MIVTTKAGVAVAAVSVFALAILTGCEPAAKAQSVAGGSEGRNAQDHSEHTAAPAAATQGPETVHLSERGAARLGVTYARAEVRPLNRTVRTVGYVTVAEPRMHWFAPKIGGWIEKLYVPSTGDRVRRGQPLIELYSPDLVTAQEELILARNLQRSLSNSTIAEVRAASDTLANSARQRLRYWDIPDQVIREIEESGRVRRTLTLQAPWSGIVMEKKVLEGNAIRPGEPLYMIADLSEVWIETEFYESDLALIREGQWVEVRVAAYPGERFDGRIEYVYPTLQEKTRTLKARIAVENRANRLKPGLYATVGLEAAVAEDALVVPAGAIVQTGERQIIFAVRPDGMLEPRQVELGVRTAEYAQVLSGLEPGERVVSSATFLIDSESNLAAALRTMAGHAHGTEE